MVELLCCARWNRNCAKKKGSILIKSFCEPWCCHQVRAHVHMSTARNVKFDIVVTSPCTFTQIPNNPCIIVCRSKFHRRFCHVSNAQFKCDFRVLTEVELDLVLQY